MTNHLLTARVLSIRYEAENINSFELVAPDGAELPPFSAGAHIDLHLDNGKVRQYSLCNDPTERHRYVVAILRDFSGRGGSVAIFEKVRPGGTLTISAPRNHFPLATSASTHMLVAGGIGVTPMMAMLAQLEAEGADFVLHYCARTPGKAAFRERLEKSGVADRLHFHYDGGDPSKGLDVELLLRDRAPGTHLYYCGPPGFMAAVRRASAHWPNEAVHYEYFTPGRSTPPDPSTEARPPAALGPGADTPIDFQIKIKSTGALYSVPNGKTIVQVLRECGMDVETSCESGLCGTCRTRYLEGEPEHRDFVLDDVEKKEYLLICCARSKSRLLVLDL